MQGVTDDADGVFQEDYQAFLNEQLNLVSSVGVGTHHVDRCEDNVAQKDHRCSADLTVSPKAETSFRLEGFRLKPQFAGCENHRGSTSSRGSRTSTSTMDTVPPWLTPGSGSSISTIDTRPPWQVLSSSSLEHVPVFSVPGTGDLARSPSSKHWLLQERMPKHAW
mmetsp:Transcript_117106/g.233375  ORF Transcript_117106/g.233375 Transcript_117106/m.233375 type:complete len:165 (+) Transcript_117106:72-566(+)|eukprot:CAMPEP_0172681038 /NCGR_PEP_ID=MMETSP1074-20121228/17174_1 /TAXON_ID=2916 /ORGANISM="Ceratium fusus, Strain PA161109" /LENGTH=164 /DNA_ID=CAMNT_0013499477 /DNA_START=71 /DNA_END=565 /DNA_ORIENTATION=-